MFFYSLWWSFQISCCIRAFFHLFPKHSLFQARPLAVWVATLPVTLPWWIPCVPTLRASFSPPPCPPWSWQGRWSPWGSSGHPRAKGWGGHTRGTSSTCGSCFWTLGCLSSTVPVTSSPYVWESESRAPGFNHVLLVTFLVCRHRGYICLLLAFKAYDLKNLLSCSTLCKRWAMRNRTLRFVTSCLKDTRSTCKPSTTQLSQGGRSYCALLHPPTITHQWWNTS